MNRDPGRQRSACREVPPHREGQLPAHHDPYLRRLDLVAVARGLPRVLLAHARDDEAVPFPHSERLAAVLAEPTRCIAVDEGGHHGPGRSPEVARATLDWVVTNGA